MITGFLYFYILLCVSFFQLLLLYEFTINQTPLISPLMPFMALKVNTIQVIFAM